MPNLLFMDGGGDFRVLELFEGMASLELFEGMASNGDDAEIAFDDDDRQNLPLDQDDLAPDRAYEEGEIEDPIPRSDEDEFLKDEFDDDWRLLLRYMNITRYI